MEFVLGGIPIIFMIISIIEVSRGMWTSNTLSFAVTEASRMAIVHGQNCSTSPNSCSITVGNIAQRIADSSQGLLANQMTVTLLSTGDGVSITCNPLSSCLGNSSLWPVFPGNSPGTDIIVTAVYPFSSPMAIFFPGFTGSAAFGTANLPATSQGRIQF